MARDLVKFNRISMNYITVTTLRNNLADAIKEVETKKDFFLVGKRGKVKTALVDIDLFEDLLELSNKSYLKSIKKAREDVEKGNVVGFKEAFGEI